MFLFAALLILNIAMDKVESNSTGVFHALDIITMNEKVLKGANVSFHCRFPNEEKLNLTEYTFYLCKDGTCIAMRKWGGESGVTFSIKNVTRYDSGNYSCVYSEQKRALEEVTVPMRTPIIFLQILDNGNDGMKWKTTKTVPNFVVVSVLCTLGSIAVLSVAMALLITLFKRMKTLKMEPATVSTPETPSEAGTSSAVDLNKRRQRQEMKAENRDDPRFPVMSENMIYEEGTSMLYHLENVAEVTQTQASTQPAVEDYAELQCFPGNSREANIEDCYWTVMTPQKKGRDFL
ncbi:uncharacterized protein LOC117432514 isoform X2 [Acipenser ruthenus]|uniref:uncharacterized protein LOC117432514 isoform X2 n=1 Tax=Acipenser ruthenus TaxID=7906 RepID=UPI0027418A4C|nr:uncharacterized protein LOC117432514 isoform X2 [Acipenser ruthenus]